MPVKTALHQIKDDTMTMLMQETEHIDMVRIHMLGMTASLQAKDVIINMQRKTNLVFVDRINTS